MTILKHILSFWLTLTIGILVNGCDNDKKQIATLNKQIEQYVSLNCKNGDITLTLDTSAKFNMTILYWDPKTNQHIGKDSIIGTWEKRNEILSLNILGNVLEYKYDTTKLEIGTSAISIPSYVLKYQEISTFADSIDLLEKNQTEKFLMKQMVK